MRTRIAVAVEDTDFCSILVGLLRNTGYLVVEPEISDFVVFQVEGQRPGVRIGDRPRVARDHQTVSFFLPSPVTARAVMDVLLQLAPRRAIDGHTSRYDH